MPTATTSNDVEQRPANQIAFERARNAVVVIRTVRPMLTSSQVETLALLSDSEAMETIEQSIEEAKRGEHRPLADAVEDAEDAK